MKRIFHRRPRSPSASARSSSPESARADQSQPKAGKFPPRRKTASAKLTSRKRSDHEEEGTRSPVSASLNGLHAKVVEFVTSATSEKQQQALHVIHEAIVDEVGAVQDAKGGRKRLAMRDVDTLISVCAQRLRSCFSRALETHNAGILDGGKHTALLATTDTDECDLIMMLQILRTLLADAVSAQTVLLVSERLPSTLVKVVKALSDGSEASAASERFVDVILEMLAILVCFPEAIQELEESSTLHRIFNLTFQSEAQQLAVVKVVEKLVQWSPQDSWRSLARHFYDHRCLLELAKNINGMSVFAKVVSVIALSMRRAITAGATCLHEQMRSDRQRLKFFALFVQFFETSDDVTESTSLEERQARDQGIADAVVELCSSGSEIPLLRGDVETNKAFALVLDLSGKTEVGLSYFNGEAFGLLSDILTYLHRPAKLEEQRVDDRTRDEIARRRERLECRYLQKLGQLIVLNRYDYEFVSRTNILSRIINQLDDYSEMAQHTVVSVLSGIAIEANVIPFSELVAINAFLGKDSFQGSTIKAILSFVANLLRFHEVYHEVLRSVGMVSTLVALFLDQTTILCSERVGLTQIRVEYPTSTIAIERPSDTLAEPAQLDERVIIALLTSHCDRRARSRSIDRNVMRRADFPLLIEAVGAFVDGVGGDAVMADEEFYSRILCGLPMLECVCALIGDDTSQLQALSLWRSILRLSLRFQRDGACVHNVVNCLLQSLRYVTLAIYSSTDDNVSLQFPRNVKIFRGILAYMEELLHPEEASATESGMRNNSPHGSGEMEFTTAERDHVLSALVDCGGLFSLLAVLCVLGRNSESNIWVTQDDDDAASSSSAVILAMKSIHGLVVSNAAAEQLFYSSVTFGYYGDLTNELLRKLFDGMGTNNASPGSNDDAVSRGTSLLRFCVGYFIGFSMDDPEVMNPDESLAAEAMQQRTTNRSGRGNTSKFPDKLRFPQSFAVAIQLLSLWSMELDTDTVHLLLSNCARIAAIPENAQRLASDQALEIMLRSFAVISDNSQGSCGSNVDDRRVSQALLGERNAFHQIAVSLVESVALVSVSYTDVNYWIKLLMHLFRVRSQQFKALGDPQRSTRLRSASRATAQPSTFSTISTPAPTLSASPASALLRVLANMTSATFERANGAPVIAFDVSNDGFAYLQIPDVNVGSASSSEPVAATPSLPAFGQNAKTWPPPDGYSVSLWFRVDAFERKEEREKLYRECFMTNKCIHCRCTVLDEYVLKCSHRACRGCVEALLNNGGDCVVCNPPTFYLFRFRSCDGKSVTEAFLKGGKLYMRTSSSRASAYQFTHSLITPKQWHHVVFTHAKQRFQSSMVSCYLDGILQETVKISYPSSVAGNQPLSGLMGVPSQARRCSSAGWTLGPFYLLDVPISTPMINAVFAAGPSYDKLFFGASGNSEISVTLDHLNMANLVLLDEYMWDPVRSLIESVDTERGGRSKLLRRSLSIASAASSAAAAIVQDIKSNASLFSRIPSAVPLIHIPVPHERIVVAYSARNAVGSDASIVPSIKLDGRPIAHLIGGTTVGGAATVADVMFEMCSSGCQVAYILLDEATATLEIELALDLLASVMRGHARNLAAMEQEHGYGVVNYLLHQKASLLSSKCLQLLFQIVGIDIELDEPETQQQFERAASPLQVPRESAIRNLQALQYFILDYSLWQKVAGSETSKLLFSSLYSCLTADDDTIRKRNRAQLQSMSFVRQLLYVLMDANVSDDLLSVIGHVVLVCLTSPTRESTVEANFADVTGFLTATLSPRFARVRTDGVDTGVSESEESASEEDSEGGAECAMENASFTGEFRRHSLASPTARLCLSPRGTQANGESWDFRNAGRTTEERAGATGLGNVRFKAQQAKIQDLLLDILMKAVQKYDVKENKERGDDADDLLVSDRSGSGASTTIGVASSATNSGAGGGSAASRIQLPSSSRLTGFRKFMAPRWMGYFLFPGDETEFSVGISPSTVIVALKLLCALLRQPRYEGYFKKEGFYRLLAQGLPCNHAIFSSVRTDTKSPSTSTRFPFQDMWYTLFCALLGTPVDGVPHEIQFEIFYLCKDFELNIQRDRVANPSVLGVIMTLLRRHYNDPVALFSMATDSDETKPGGGEENRSVSAALTPSALIEGSGMYHLEVLDFLQHIFENMPSLQRLLISGSDKVRQELLEELARAICAAARTHVLAKYSPTQDRIVEALQTKQVTATEYNAAVCRVELAEEAAAVDANGSDPFLHHPIAARALRLLIAVLLKCLLDSPKGYDMIEEFIEGAPGVTIVIPPMHDALLLRFQSLVVMGLLDHIRPRFNDEEVLTNHRSFGPNVREFVKFVVGKMHSWQRAQHGDGCPLAFACCGRAHFIGGPSRLLELVLFVLAETNVGVVGSGGIGSSSQMAPASSSLGGMLSDKLNRGKKRRQFRQLIGRMNMSRSVELESLAAELYTALNAVVLHVFHGRGVEIDDEELEAMLQQAHVHREVVLGSRNNQDKDFFVCLCRYLLQLLADSSARPLQEAAAHLWIDLMYFQRAFMVDLLTIEIRKSGAPPYTVNLMKNGFDVLLEDSATSSSPEEELLIQSPSFVKFSKWLEVVGPPLKELEINMDRVFIKTVMEAKETVHEAWAGYHKKALHQKHKSEKQFDSRYEWLVSMEKDYVESLLRSQRNEFRRQLKWRQDRVDRQKFIARQWQHVQQGFMQNSLGGELGKDESTMATARTPALMAEVRKISGCARLDDQPAQLFCWRLDFTEGPYRTRKRLSRMIQTTEHQSRALGQHLSLGKDNIRVNFEADGALENDAQIAELPRRRYSEADADRVATEALETPSRTHSKQLSAEQQAETRTMDDVQRSATRRPLTTAVSASSVLTTKERLRRGSFEALFNKYVGHERSSWLKGLSAHQESAIDRDGSGEEGDESDGNNGSETPGVVESTTGDVVVEEEVIDEKLRPLLMPGDEILDLYDCLRVDGMDSCPGVFLLCNGHVYIIDNYQRLAQQPLPPQSGSGINHAHQNVQARVVEVAQGTSALFERRLSLHHYQELSQATELTTATARQSKSGLQDTHQCRFWAYDDITELHKRRYQLRHVALEIFAHDGRNYLITLESHQQREHVFHALLSKCPNVRGPASGLDGVAAGGDLYSQLRKLLRNSMTERWVHGDISNFAYLMHLNTLAGRSYNDLTQYPVFPWILADYDSEELDLSSPSIYRDLAKPMGALRREEEFRARYDGLVESAATEDAADHPLSSRPFHYGTHYSSAAITLHYLMRLEPFTTHFRRLHGGKFDHADRLFTSVGGAWKSAAGFEGAQNGTQDVKELTPEFFYLPAFLENVNNRAFGTSQTGVVVGDVELPPWANGSTTEFVRLNRAALESPFVSARLHHWIDLIFGFKQQGPAAIEACNVFYHLTYEGAVDLDAIADLPTKRAILDQITEFGQTPSQLFRTPHPARVASAVATGSPVGNSSFLSNSMGPLSAFHNSQGGSNAAADNVSTASSSANMGTIAASPMTTRGALASSFLEGGELINRMHTILSSGAGLSGTVVGAAEATSVPILENAAILKQEACRQAAMNPLLSSHRRSYQTASQQSNLSPSIHQIARTSGSVGREERLVSVGPKCLLIPPRNSEFLAWGFQDRSVKVISAGSTENGGHGGDAKVVACLELDVDLEVAAITADGRIVVTSSPETPVLRVWRFDAVRRSLAASLAAASASSSSTPSSSAAAAASSLAAASALSAPHRRRVYATMGSSVRSLTLLAAMSSPAHAQQLTALHVSRAYSVIVSGCSGGIAVLWDLNRRRFIRRLPSLSRGPSAIAAIAINEVTGDIVVAAGAAFGVYDINGALRVLLDDSAMLFSSPTAFPQAPITALAVNRSESCEWSAEKQVVTGHADGVLCVWAYAQTIDGVLEKTGRPKSEDKWTIELQGKHQVTPSSAITAVSLTTDERRLYTGTHGGQLALWTPSALGSAATFPEETPPSTR